MLVDLSFFSINDAQFHHLKGITAADITERQQAHDAYVDKNSAQPHTKHQTATQVPRRDGILDGGPGEP